jgi:hypothetical protein
MEVGMVVLAGSARTAVTDDQQINRAQRSIRTPAGRSPIRLTGRGRIALTSAAALLVGMVSVALATAAQASHAGGPDDRRYVTRMAVGPGQNLWSIAQAYDPDADPRAVIAQIVQLNSLSGDQLQPGEELWVPRG